MPRVWLCLAQQPLALGIDLSMQSATNYLNGHSDVTGGVVTGSKALLAPIEKTRRLLGTVMDPHPAYALGRGLKTLPLRVAQHNANARAVADFLAQDRRVSQVYYPGLPSHPDHAIAARQMSGFGGMVCFDLGGSYQNLTRLFGGSYMPIAAADWPFTINPFVLSPTPDNLRFLFQLVLVLAGSNGYRPTADDEKDLFEQIKNLYEIDPSQRPAPRGREVCRPAGERAAAGSVGAPSARPRSRFPHPPGRVRARESVRNS